MLFQEQRWCFLEFFFELFSIYLGGYLQCLELIMSVSRTKLMSSGGKGSKLGQITI